MKKILVCAMTALIIATLFLAGCSNGNYKTGGGGQPQHYNPNNGQYD